MQINRNNFLHDYFQAVKKGEIPDIIEIPHELLPNFINNKIICRIDSNYIEGNSSNLEFISKYNPIVRDYAIPWLCDTKVLFYNKRILRKFGLDEKAPASFRELILKSEVISIDDSVFATGIPLLSQMDLYELTIIFLYNLGGEIFDNNNRLYVNSPKNIEILESLLNFAQVGLPDTQRNIEHKFIDGKIGFCFAGISLINEVLDASREVEYGICNIPGVNGMSGLSIPKYTFLAINTKSTQRNEALKMIEELNKPEFFLEFQNKSDELILPADKIDKSAMVFEPDKNLSVISNQLRFVIPLFNNTETHKIEKIMYNAVKSCILGKESPERALEIAQGKISKFYSNVFSDNP